MTFETSPAKETNVALDVGPAAARAGLSVPSFRTLMSKLNGTQADLRTPPRAGQRARQYDQDKLDAWILAGRPIPDFPDQAAEEPAVHFPATATWAGNRWNITTEAPQVSVSAPDLKTATRRAAEEVTSLMSLPGNVVLDVAFDVDDQARQKWAEAAKLRAQGDKLLSQAVQKRREVVAALVDAGMSLPDIGQVLGISYQRVQQIHTGKNRQDPHPTR